MLTRHAGGDALSRFVAPFRIDAGSRSAKQAPRRAAHPAKPLFHLAVGVTGHRPPVLHADHAPAERQQLRFVLDRLAAAAVALAEREAQLFDTAPFVPRLISSLAEGADQLAARVALAGGYRVQAVLPLARDDYRTDFSPEGADSFDRLLARSDCVLELPHPQNSRDESYALAGRAVVAHCDVLVALWDGAPARGPGGTAENVGLALRHGIPVIHLPVGAPDEARILWTGYGEFIDPDDLEALPTRAVDAAALDELVAAVLGPPADARARADLDTYLGEHERRTRTRTEYPLLLAALGVKRISRQAFRTSAYELATEGEWRAFHEACGGGQHGINASMGEIERSFAWADQLAQLFAQNYRSGHILNFALASLAVLIALAGLTLPRFHFFLALAEPLAIATFVVNTWIGTKRQWHRRWLEYRQLAERIRPMRSLKLLGVAAPPAMRRNEAGAAGWVEWYARAQWRASGCPAGRTSDMAALITSIVTQEIEPQIRYHRASAHQMHKLDHRLHVAGMALFSVSILSCIVSALANVFAPHFADGHAALFISLSAGLPAVGAALFGIRMQGDFGGTAQRSLVTADELGRVVRALDLPDIGLARQTDLIEAAATTMLSELGEWRRIYQQRRLELPG